MAYDGRNFGNRQGGGRSGPGGDPNYKKGKLPEGYLSGGYFEVIDGEKALRPEYIVKYPKEIAEKLSSQNEWEKWNSPQNKRSQVRRFYEYGLRIQGLLRRKHNHFAAVEAELGRLLPFVKYAESRGTVSVLFRNFIDRNITAVHDGEDLNAFMKHFEAVIAYLPKEKN